MPPAGRADEDLGGAMSWLPHHQASVVDPRGGAKDHRCSAPGLTSAEVDPREAAIGVLAAIDGLLLVRFVLGADHADRATAWLLAAVSRSDGSV